MHHQSARHQVRAREIDLDNASLTQQVEAQKQALIHLQEKASVCFCACLSKHDINTASIKLY